MAGSKTRRHYDQWAKTYDVSRPVHTRMEERHILEMLAPRAGEWILDAACGTGKYAGLCEAKGARAIGFDCSAGMLQTARERLPGIDFVEADLERPLPFADGRFDKVVCALALKHVADLTFAFSELARVTRGEGTLVFSTSAPSPETQPKTRGAKEVSVSTELFDYSSTDLESAFAPAGFQLEECREIEASEREREWLSPQEFEAWRGKPLVIAFRVRLSRDKRGQRRPEAL